MGKSQIFIFVLASGAVGGLLSWVYSLAVGNRLSLSGWQAVGASVALGVGASWIGVYLLAHTDTSDLARALAFALLCGFAWKPVFDAGTALVEKRQVIKAEQKIAELEDAIAKLSDTQDGAQAEAVVKLAKDAIETTSAADRRSLDRRVNRSVGSLAATLAASPEVLPASAARLAEVGDVAIESGYPDAALSLAGVLRNAAATRAGDETQVAANFEAIDQMSAAAARKAPEVAEPLARLGAETAFILTENEGGGDESTDGGAMGTTSPIAPEQRREILSRAVGRLENPLGDTPLAGELRELDERALKVRLDTVMAEPPVWVDRSAAPPPPP